MDDFTYTLKNVQPMAEWVETPETEERCPPCLISPIASEYLGELSKAGETKLAGELKRAYESKDIPTIAKALDVIKSKVGDTPLLKSLLDLDCFAQVFKA